MTRSVYRKHMQLYSCIADKSYECIALFHKYSAAMLCRWLEALTYIHTCLFAQKFPISQQNTKEQQSWTKKSFRHWHSPMNNITTDDTKKREKSKNHWHHLDDYMQWHIVRLNDVNDVQECRAAARKPCDAARVLFCWSLPTTFTTSIRLAKLRKRPRFRAPNMLTHNAI